jgi:hypothetical protein
MECDEVQRARSSMRPSITSSWSNTRKIPSTIDAAALRKMTERGQITGALLDGPPTFDNAIAKEAAEIKGIRSEVAGDADILLVPVPGECRRCRNRARRPHADHADLARRYGACAPAWRPARSPSSSPGRDVRRLQRRPRSR